MIIAEMFGKTLTISGTRVIGGDKEIERRYASICGPPEYDPEMEFVKRYGGKIIEHVPAVVGGVVN